MKRGIIGISTILAGSLYGALWVDEATLQSSILKSNDVQSKILYARYLMEHDKTTEALKVLEGIDVKAFPVSLNLRKEILQWEEDNRYFERLGLKVDGSNILDISRSLNPKESEQFYFALKRHHFVVNNETKRVIGNTIAQGENKTLAGSLLYNLPKTTVPSVIVQSPIPQPVVIEKKEEAQKTIHLVDSQIKESFKSLPQQLDEALSLYEKKPDNKSIETILYLYSELNKEEEKINFLKQHLLSHPFDYESRLLLGKYLGWDGKFDEALDYLHMVEGPLRFDAQLLSGQIYAWKGDYLHAKTILDEIVRYGDKKIQYDAKKTLGYISRWNGEHAQAKEIFLALNKLDPSDQEVQDEVWFDQKNFQPLIDKAMQALRKNSNDLKSLERLSSLYMLDKQPEKAIFYLEKQYALTQKPQLLKEMGNTALSMKQTTRGMNYWRAYAMKMDTPEVWFEYAQNLLWSGYKKESLEILKTLQTDPSIGKKSKELIRQIEPSLGMKLIGSVLALVMGTSSIVAQEIATVYTEEAQYAEHLEKEHQYLEASRIYRVLYLKTSDETYAKKYIGTLHASGRHEEAQSVASTLNEEDVIATATVSKPTNIISSKPLNRDYDQPITSDEVPSSQNRYRAGISGDRLSDTDDLSVYSAKVTAGVMTSNNLSINTEVGGYKIKNPTESMDGASGFISTGTDTFELGMYVDTIDHKTEFNPYLRLSYPIAPHTVSLIAYRRNVGLIKNALKPLKNHNTLTSVALSDYALFPDNDEFWGSIEVAWDEKDNVITTPQFQYRFFQTPISSALYSLSVDGWYTFNSDPTPDYYSPSFSDGNYLTNYLEIPMFEKVQLRLMGGLGYSFDSEVYLYKLGGWIERPLNDDMTFRLGCSDFNSINSTGANLPYSYDTCDMKFLYYW